MAKITLNVVVAALLAGILAPHFALAHFVWMRIDTDSEITTAHLFFSEGGTVVGDRLPERIENAQATIHVSGAESYGFTSRSSGNGRIGEPRG